MDLTDLQLTPASVLWLLNLWSYGQPVQRLLIILLTGVTHRQHTHSLQHLLPLVILINMHTLYSQFSEGRYCDSVSGLQKTVSTKIGKYFADGSQICEGFMWSDNGTGSHAQLREVKL